MRNLTRKLLQICSSQIPNNNLQAHHDYIISQETKRRENVTNLKYRRWNNQDTKLKEKCHWPLHMPPKQGNKLHVKEYMKRIKQLNKNALTFAP